MHSPADVEILVARARELNIPLEEFRAEDGSIDSVNLAWRISEIERHTHGFAFGRLLLVCVGAFLLCGFGTWLALKLAH